MNLKFIFNAFNTPLTSYAGKVTMENNEGFSSSFWRAIRIPYQIVSLLGTNFLLPRISLGTINCRS